MGLVIGKARAFMARTLPARLLQRLPAFYPVVRTSKTAPRAAMRTDFEVNALLTLVPIQTCGYHKVLTNEAWKGDQKALIQLARSLGLPRRSAPATVDSRIGKAELCTTDKTPEEP